MAAEATDVSATASRPDERSLSARTSQAWICRLLAVDAEEGARTTYFRSHVDCADGALEQVQSRQCSNGTELGEALDRELAVGDKERGVSYTSRNSGAV